MNTDRTIPMCKIHNYGSGSYEAVSVCSGGGGQFKLKRN